MTRTRTLVLAGLLACAPLPAFAETVTVTVNRLLLGGEIGEAIGTVRLRDSFAGMVIAPQLSGLAPGRHGFHVHQNPSCKAATKNGRLVPGLGAGGHYDPTGTGKHLGFTGKGHLGDLPALIVETDGKATISLLAPRLKVSDVRGRALIIHARGDNYSDLPKRLGGGGARVACGLIP
ncbi:MAG: superoxide dismutase [Cu-Zn] SodC [Pseudomonadota bacterium]